MTNTCLLVLASLVTTQPGPAGGDYNPVVSCNKQGTVFDSVWQEISGGVTKNYHQRNTGSTAPSDSNGAALVTSSTNNVNLTNVAQVPPVVVDTDDTSSSNPNYAAVWCSQSTTSSCPPQPWLPHCTVNGNTSFTAGSSSCQGTAACVAVMRQYWSGTNMAVAIAFQDGLGTVYAQVFEVSSSTGSVVSSGSPVVVSNVPGHMSQSGSIALGGIAGDDYGNFVVSYVRQTTAEGAPPTGTYVAGFTFSNLLTGSTLGFQGVQVYSGASSYTFCRVACYHGSSSTNGGFVVGIGHGSSTPSAQRYTTNWTSSPSLAATTTFGSYPMPDFAVLYPWFQIACVRDTQGNYMVTWSTPYSSGSANAPNVVHSMVSGDTAGAVTYVTEYVDSPCYDGGPPAFSVQPSVALSDSGAGPVFQLDYIYLSNVNPWTGVIKAVLP